MEEKLLEESSSPHLANYALSTLSIHADDPLNSITDVAPAMHVSTTFRYSHNPDKLVPAGEEEEVKCASTTLEAAFD